MRNEVDCAIKDSWDYFMAQTFLMTENFDEFGYSYNFSY